MTPVGSAAVLVIAMLALTGCNGGTEPIADPVPMTAIAPTAGPVTSVPSPVPSVPASLGTPLYLVDANTSNALGDSIPVGLLSGVKGTIPGADVPEPFKLDLLTVDPNLTNFAYAAEAYDAVILAALAAASGASDTGSDMAGRLLPITHGSDACYHYSECLALLAAGREIDYNGRSGVVDFSDTGDPTSATVGVYTFGPDNLLLPDAEYRVGRIEPQAARETAMADPQRGAGDAVFRIATYLPITGSFSYLGPSELAGVKLAVRDITASGGVPGFSSVDLVEGDSADGSLGTAPKVIKRLLRSHPDVIIGAGSSAATINSLGQVTEAGVLMISPSSTMPELSSLPDRGLFWRTAPSDVLQGASIGSAIVADGHRRVAVISRRGLYGSGLTDNLEQALAAGGAQVVVEVRYAADAADFAATVAAVKSAEPDAIVLIGADESAKVVTELVQQGIGPN